MVPPSRARAAGAYAPAHARGAVTTACPTCTAKPYRRCYRMVGEQQVFIRDMHRARHDAHRGDPPEVPPQEVE